MEIILNRQQKSETVNTKESDSVNVWAWIVNNGLNRSITKTRLLRNEGQGQLFASFPQTISS